MIRNFSVPNMLSMLEDNANFRSDFILLGLKIRDCRLDFKPTLELHSRAASSVDVMSLLHQSQHRKQFRRKADNLKKVFVKLC